MTIKRAWVILGIVTAVTAAVAIVKNKIAATLLGPEGVGLYSQANIFIVFVTTICTLGVGQGVVKHLAERHEEDLDGITRREIIGTSLLLQVSLALVLVALILVFHSIIARWIFGANQSGKFILIAAGAIPFSLLFLNFGYFLQGTSQITKFSLATTLNAIASLIVFVLFVYRYGLDGAVFSLLASATISVVIFGSLLRGTIKTIWNERNGKNKFPLFSKKVSKILLLYGTATFIGGFFETFNILVLRSWILNVAGAAQNGIYQAAVNLSGQYIGFFTLFNTTYLFPKLSALRDEKLLGIEVNKSLSLGALFVTPVLGMCLIFREEIILLLFTPAFLAASSILVWQVLGDFLKIAAWFVSATLLPTGRLREFVLLSIVYCGLSLGLSLIFLYQWSTVGIAIAHFCTYVVYLILVVSVQKRIIKLSFAPQTLRLLGFSVATLLFAAFFPHGTLFDVILKVAVTVVWCAYAMWEMRMQIRQLLQNQFLKVQNK